MHVCVPHPCLLLTPLNCACGYDWYFPPLPSPPAQELRSHKEVVRVDPKYHSKIIGKKGAVINKIRKDFSVQIQFPEKEGDGGEDSDVIEITGYEHQTKSARDAIMKVVEELVRVCVCSLVGACEFFQSFTACCGCLEPLLSVQRCCCSFAFHHRHLCCYYWLIGSLLHTHTHTCTHARTHTHTEY